MEYSALWNFVQGLSPGAALAPSDVQIALAPFADRLTHLLKFKVRKRGIRVLIIDTSVGREAQHQVAADHIGSVTCERARSCAV